ncbi:MAG: hypothetical protein WD602_05910 [Actinomycetota bacterium]
MSTPIRHSTSKGPALPSLELQQATTRLNRRIVLVAAVVMAELWTLTAAFESWAVGETSKMGWILGFQLVCFLLALSICWGAGAPARVKTYPATHRFGSPQPAAGD